jgi:hypothetical protein
VHFTHEIVRIEPFQQRVTIHAYKEALNSSAHKTMEIILQRAQSADAQSADAQSADAQSAGAQSASISTRNLRHYGPTVSLFDSMNPALQSKDDCMTTIPRPRYDLPPVEYEPAKQPPLTPA